MITPLQRLTETVRSEGVIGLGDLRLKIGIARYEQFRRLLMTAVEKGAIEVERGAAVARSEPQRDAFVPLSAVAPSMPAHNQRRATPDELLMQRLEDLLREQGPLQLDIARERLCCASQIRFAAATRELIKRGTAERASGGTLRIVGDQRPVPRWNSDWAYQPSRRARASA